MAHLLDEGAVDVGVDLGCYDRAVAEYCLDCTDASASIGRDVFLPSL